MYDGNVLYVNHAEKSFSWVPPVAQADSSAPGAQPTAALPFAGAPAFKAEGQQMQARMEGDQMEMGHAGQAAPADEDGLAVGDLVEIHSLRGAPELNGLRGQIVMPKDPETGRWRVKSRHAHAHTHTKTLSLHYFMYVCMCVCVCVCVYSTQFASTQHTVLRVYTVHTVCLYSAHCVQVHTVCLYSTPDADL